MNEVLKNRKVNCALFILLIVVSLFFVIKTVNEFKASKYVGYDAGYPNVIYVEGQGEVSAISDIASLYFNLTKDAETAKESQELLNEEVTKVLTYLKEQGIEDKDIKSEYGGLSPKYSYEKPACYTYPCPARETKITGYTANQSISIKVREVDSANEVRTGLSDLGVANITGPTFSIDDEESYKAQARTLAIKDAQEKAQILANDLGVKLGKITNFSEGGNNYYSPMMKSMDMMESAGVAMSSAPELPKGENKINSSITITYEIK